MGNFISITKKEEQNNNDNISSCDDDTNQPKQKDEPALTISSAHSEDLLIRKINIDNQYQNGGTKRKITYRLHL